MSKITGKIKALWRRLADKEYRDAYVANRVANDIAFQVYYMRESREWTQGQLAEVTGTRQPAISRLERSVGSVNVGTLVKIAAAFNVGLSIRFVPFSKLIGRVDTLDADVPEFDHDYPPIISSNPITVGTRTPVVHSWKAEQDFDSVFFSTTGDAREGHTLQ